MMMKIFGSKAPAAQNGGKTKSGKPSLFGVLFNPHLGDSIRPMGEAFTAFVHMIAMVFAMNGLFPKDHPALKGEPNAPRLTLSYILQTAWNDLSFTKEGLPKVLLFFAVAGAIILSILSIITALALGFVGQAHAQAASTSVFTAPSPSSDLAINWIDFLFNPKQSSTAATNLSQTMQGMTQSAATLPTTAVQKALWSALGIYSDAILVIAAFILFYHLASMIVETAHHGVPMGKRANQIWAPIRLVVAIGLLVPISASGLNCGQYIVIQLAEAGSALASNVWKGFVSTLVAESTVPAPSGSQDVSTAVYDLTMMYGCEYAYNFQVYAESLNGSVDLSQENVNGWAWTGLNNAPPAVQGTTPAKYSFSNNYEKGVDMCGSFTIPAEPVASDPYLQPTIHSAYQGIIKAFNTANAAAANYSPKIQYSMGHDFTTFNQNVKNNFSQYATTAHPLSVITVPPGAGPSMEDLQPIALAYSNAIGSAMPTSVSISSAMSTTVTNLSDDGWPVAGSLFNKMSSYTAEMAEMERLSLPSTIPPSLNPNGGPVTEKINDAVNSRQGRYRRESAEESAIDSTYLATIKDLSGFSGSLGVPATPTNSSPSASNSGSPSAAAPAKPSFWSSLDSCGPSDPMVCLFGLVEYVAAYNGVWRNPSTNANNLTLGVQFAGGNPLMEIAAFGHANIQAGLDMFKYGIYLELGSPIAKMLATATTIASWAAAPFTGGLSILGGAFLAGALKVLASAATLFASMLFFLGSLFFGIGAVMAFVIPLLPFLHFFFNTITWITCIAEAIIGIPLVALAHLHPDGDGLPGNAKGAYQMIFSILLRPVMMVFGLICGLLILYVAAGLLNTLYAYAVAGAGSGQTATTSASHMVISRIMFTVMYVMALVSVANHAFGLISRLPNQALDWMGGKGLNGEKMGDPSRIEPYVGAAAGYLGGKAASQVTEMGKGAGQLAGFIAKNRGDAHQRNLNSLASDEGKADAVRESKEPGSAKGLSRNVRWAGGHDAESAYDSGLSGAKSSITQGQIRDAVQGDKKGTTTLLGGTDQAMDGSVRQVAQQAGSEAGRTAAKEEVDKSTPTFQPEKPSGGNGA